MTQSTWLFSNHLHRSWKIMEITAWSRDSTKLCVYKQLNFSTLRFYFY